MIFWKINLLRGDRCNRLEIRVSLRLVTGAGHVVRYLTIDSCVNEHHRLMSWYTLKDWKRSLNFSSAS